MGFWWCEGGGMVAGGRCRVEREERWEEREKYLVINEDKSLGFNFLYSLNTRPNTWLQIRVEKSIKSCLVKA